MMDEKAYIDLFETFSNTKIGVIGDIMLDTYWWGNVDRISPEAPVPIVSLQKKEIRVGGAANVALNLRALGVPTALFAIIGKDTEGNELMGLLKKEGINTNYITRHRPAGLCPDRNRKNGCFCHPYPTIVECKQGIR